MRRAAPAAAAALLAACAANPRHPLPEKAAASLAVASVDPLAGRFELEFRVKGKKSGSALFERLEPAARSVTVRRGADSCRVGKEFEALLTRVTAIGTVDLLGVGKDQLFILNEDGGTGSHDETMLLVDPADCGVAGLSVTVFHQATRRTTPETALGRFLTLDRKPERAFLNAIKYRYGFVGTDDADRQERNPEYAYYFWARDNGSLTDGVMKIRRYKGRPAAGGGVEAELRDGARVYTAQFKAGVVAYDSAADEHFVLYHPSDMYAWPVLLQREGSWLLIGTRGEGVAAVDLKDFRLKRFRFQDSTDTVKTLERRGATIVVNGSRELTLPGL